jgi:hypothetical protein
MLDIMCEKPKSHSHHQMERAEGAPKDPERVASSDHARESSNNAIVMDLSTTYTSTYGRSRDRSRDMAGGEGQRPNTPTVSISTKK